MKKYMYLLPAIILLSGCWDQNLLKDVQLVYTVGWDQNEDGSVTSTALAPPIDQTVEHVNRLTIEGNTLRDARYNMDVYVAEHIDFAKLQAGIVGIDMARDKLYPFLDVLYRNPKNHLNARLAMTNTSAAELLSSKIDSQRNQSEYFSGLLESSELTSVVPNISLQRACTILFDPGTDLYLPYITYEKDMLRAKVSGIGLFSKQKYTDVYLNEDQSVIFNILNNETSTIVTLTKRITDGKEPEVSNWVSVNIEKSKTDIKIKENPFRAEIMLKADVVISEYGPDHLQSEKKLNEFKTFWEKELKKDIDEILEITQEVESDVFGIGKRTAAFKPAYWDEERWHDIYRDMEITSKVSVKMIGTGIID
ncbi:Ger(x)C family spore germination protein [Jeotgalibacillus aurantiacus]|uniref:Ger(x)C family spore germination protein n=1 Tax=Jeotgalibacillus aurantiacus TaxID=2763266 RepID=UPI001D0AB961|nr:Ger(x)C family spore germination protein [Jeotgalibacillus aurantiacus]